MSRQVTRLEAIFEAIIDEARSNEAFATRLEQALKGAKENVGRQRNRRPKAALDPFRLFEIGETELRAALAELDLDQVKDIVAEYGMDGSRLALKWRSSERLANLIVDTVRARARKGDAFRSRLPEPTQSDSAVTAAGDSIAAGSGPSGQAEDGRARSSNHKLDPA